MNMLFEEKLEKFELQKMRNKGRGKIKISISWVGAVDSHLLKAHIACESFWEKLLWEIFVSFVIKDVFKLKWKNIIIISTFQLVSWAGWSVIWSVSFIHWQCEVWIFKEVLPEEKHWKGKRHCIFNYIFNKN